jgi:ER lumen protein retaining receptor
VLFNRNHKDPFEYSLSFSLFLESVAILPQLVLLMKQGETENLTSNYIACLGAYRALYLINWIYRLCTEKNYRAWISWICGIVQTILYADFFYQFVKSKMRGKQFELPTND